MQGKSTSVAKKTVLLSLTPYSLFTASRFINSRETGVSYSTIGSSFGASSIFGSSAAISTSPSGAGGYLASLFFFFFLSFLDFFGVTFKFNSFFNFAVTVPYLTICLSTLVTSGLALNMNPWSSSSYLMTLSVLRVWYYSTILLGFTGA